MVRAFPALLCLALLAVPAADASYTARSFLDVGAGYDFGTGLGLYDPSNPNNPCIMLATQSHSGLLPFLTYYMGARYWPGPGVNVFQPVGLYVIEPTSCILSIPNDGLVVDSLQLDAGGAFWIDDLLGPSEVANLGLTAMTMQYCTNPLSIAGPPPYQFFAQRVACTAPTSDALYPVLGCPTFGLVTVPGSVSATHPVFLQDAQCNSLQGQPGPDFTAQRCVTTSLFNTVTGVTTAARDSDFFVVGKTGSLLPWTVDPIGPMPGQLFPNVSNLQANVGC